MSNRKKELRIGTSEHPSLFDDEHSMEGALDISQGFRQCLSDEIKRYQKKNPGKSRYDIAAKVSELTGRNLSKAMLDNYTSSDPNDRISAEVLVALCYVIHSLEPFRFLLRPLGSDAIDPDEGDYVRLYRLQKKEAELAAEIAKTKAKLGIK